jgi:hypothetical protein
MPLIPYWGNDYLGFALSIWNNEGLRPSLYALGVALLFAILLRPRRGRQQPAAKKDIPLPKQGRAWFTRYEKPIKTGGVTFESKWRHIGAVATTGARKSTLLAEIANQLGVPCVVITGDHAPPLANWVQSDLGVFWQARGNVAWYPWGGDLELAVQRVEYMFPATGNDVGVHRGMFKNCARVAWKKADEDGVKRTLDQVMDQMRSSAGGAGQRAMVENWCARLNEMVATLGGSLGTETDMLDVLESGRSFMVSLNSFQDLSNRKRFASIAVLEALRAAESRGNIGVVIDEVALVGAELFADAVRTFRVRGVTGVFASQIAQDFPPAVRGNVNVWFLGQQSGGDKASREWSSDATFGLIRPEHFGEHKLPHGKFYVVAGGRVQQAKINTWKMRPIPISASVTYESQEQIQENGYTPRTEIIELDQTPLRELPGPSYISAELQAGGYIENGCLRWRGSHLKNKKGEQTYGRLHVPGIGWEYVHILRWEQAYGPIPRGEDGKRSLTIDHMRTCFKDCFRLEHLEGNVTRGENTKRRWRVAGLGGAGGA